MFRWFRMLEHDDSVLCVQSNVFLILYSHIGTLQISGGLQNAAPSEGPVEPPSACSCMTERWNADHSSKHT
jgi:hypothetical protein